MNRKLDVVVAMLCDDEDTDLVTLPIRINDEDACFDIFPFFKENKLVINPNETVKIRTGIGMTFNRGYVGILKERSSTGSLGIGQRAGVIDSGFLGEWIIVVTNHDSKPVVICKDINKLDKDTKRRCTVLPYNKAICQVLFVELPKAKIRQISKSEFIKLKSNRGTNAFGSTDNMVYMTLEESSEKFGVDIKQIEKEVETNITDINGNNLSIGDIVSLAEYCTDRAIIAKGYTDDREAVIVFKTEKGIIKEWVLDNDTVQMCNISKIGKCISK